MAGDAKTVDKISSCALKVLEEEGPQAVSMRRIAKAVGITPMAIYYYFPTRDQLLSAITDGEFQALLKYIEARHNKTETMRPRMILDLMEGYIDYAMARPRIFDFIFSTERTGARRFPEDFRERKSPTLNVVADAVEECMRSGKLRRDDHWEVAFELWAHVHGYITLFRAGRVNLSEKKFRVLCRRSLERLMDGLKS